MQLQENENAKSNHM